MSVIIGAGVIGTLILGYVGRKGWLAFHRAVGITPGTLKYVEPSQLPPPEMIRLDLDNNLIQNLPPVVIEQLMRIDNKADVYQAWRDDRQQSGRTVSTTEDEFVIQKLLNTRLPEVIQSYQNIVRHDNRLQQSNHLKNVNSVMSKNQTDALNLLLELLVKIEEKLDVLLSQCQKDALQEMQVMNRYLKNRR